MRSPATRRSMRGSARIWLCRPAPRRSRISRPISPARSTRCRLPPSGTSKPRARSPACCKDRGRVERAGRGRDHRAADPPAGIAADDVAAVPDESCELPLIFRRRNAKRPEAKASGLSVLPVLSALRLLLHNELIHARECVVDSAARRRANDQGRCRRDRPGIARDIVATHRRHGRSPAGRVRCRQGNFDLRKREPMLLDMEQEIAAVAGGVEIASPGNGFCR